MRPVMSQEADLNENEFRAASNKVAFAHASELLEALRAGVHEFKTEDFNQVAENKMLFGKISTVYSLFSHERYVNLDSLPGVKNIDAAGIEICFPTGANVHVDVDTLLFATDSGAFFSKHGEKAGSFLRAQPSKAVSLAVMRKVTSPSSASTRDEKGCARFDTQTVSAYELFHHVEIRAEGEPIPAPAAPAAPAAPKDTMQHQQHEHTTRALQNMYIYPDSGIVSCYDGFWNSYSCQKSGACNPCAKPGTEGWWIPIPWICCAADYMGTCSKSYEACDLHSNWLIGWAVPQVCYDTGGLKSLVGWGHGGCIQAQQTIAELNANYANGHVTQYNIPVGNTGFVIRDTYAHAGSKYLFVFNYWSSPSFHLKAELQLGGLAKANANLVVDNRVTLEASRTFTVMDPAGDNSWANIPIPGTPFQFGIKPGGITVDLAGTGILQGPVSISASANAAVTTGIYYTGSNQQFKTDANWASTGPTMTGRLAVVYISLSIVVNCRFDLRIGVLGGLLNLNGYAAIGAKAEYEEGLKPTTALRLSLADQSRRLLDVDNDASGAPAAAAAAAATPPAGYRPGDAVGLRVAYHDLEPLDHVVAFYTLVLGDGAEHLIHEERVQVSATGSGEWTTTWNVPWNFNLRTYPSDKTRMLFGFDSMDTVTPRPDIGSAVHDVSPGGSDAVAARSPRSAASIRLTISSRATLRSHSEPFALHMGDPQQGIFSSPAGNTVLPVSRGGYMEAKWNPRHLDFFRPNTRSWRHGERAQTDKVKFLLYMQKIDVLTGTLASLAIHNFTDLVTDNTGLARLGLPLTKLSKYNRFHLVVHNAQHINVAGWSSGFFSFQGSPLPSAFAPQLSRHRASVAAPARPPHHGSSHMSALRRLNSVVDPFKVLDKCMASTDVQARLTFSILLFGGIDGISVSIPGFYSHTFPLSNLDTPVIEFPIMRFCLPRLTPVVGDGTPLPVSYYSASSNLATQVSRNWKIGQLDLPVAYSITLQMKAVGSSAAGSNILLLLPPTASGQADKWLPNFGFCDPSKAGCPSQGLQLDYSTPTQGVVSIRSSEAVPMPVPAYFSIFLTAIWCTIKIDVDSALGTMALAATCGSSTFKAQTVSWKPSSAGDKFHNVMVFASSNLASTANVVLQNVAVTAPTYPTIPAKRSNGQMQAAAVEGATCNLVCPSSQIISVKGASFGTLTGTFPNLAGGACSLAGAGSTAGSMCNGYIGSCGIPVSLVSMGGDPCSGTLKSLKVDYTCADARPTWTSSAHTLGEIVCASGAQCVLLCPAGQLIGVQWTAYGRLQGAFPNLENGLCPGTSDFATYDLIDSVSSTCDGQNSCIYMAPTSASSLGLPDLCPNYSSMLAVDWTCSFPPTLAPTVDPTAVPTVWPTEMPTDQPTAAPTEMPSDNPTEAPTEMPTDQPSEFPTLEPSMPPSAAPSSLPTTLPTAGPTTKWDEPSAHPTHEPTAPSAVPSALPTLEPSSAPSVPPTLAPSALPSKAPSNRPSALPSLLPSASPTTHMPSLSPSAAPSSLPTTLPTTASPTPGPTVHTTAYPTVDYADRKVFYKLAWHRSSNCSDEPYYVAVGRETKTHMDYMTAVLSGCAASGSSSFLVVEYAGPVQQHFTRGGRLFTHYDSVQACLADQPTVQYLHTDYCTTTGATSFKLVCSTSSQYTLQGYSDPTCSSAVPSYATSQDFPPPCKPTSAGDVVTESCLVDGMVMGTAAPTPAPSPAPTLQPSAKPSLAPSVEPSLAPSNRPSALPSLLPSASPTTHMPSLSPSAAPSSLPTTLPTAGPTTKWDEPSAHPTHEPTAPSAVPSALPTLEPSSAPSVPPTLAPSALPSKAPSNPPSAKPSTKPTLAPTHMPSLFPSTEPTPSPPSPEPSQTALAPTLEPSLPMPTLEPSAVPSTAPSAVPTVAPTIVANVWAGLTDCNGPCAVTIPPRAFAAQIVLYGAAGGAGGASGSGALGGAGASLALTLPVAPGDVLVFDAGQAGQAGQSAGSASNGVAVGGAGGGGGGQGVGGGGGGGGATKLLKRSADGSYGLVAIAGGGGGGFAIPSTCAGVGGAGGGTRGRDGKSSCARSKPGLGGLGTSAQTSAGGDATTRGAGGGAGAQGGAAGSDGGGGGGSSAVFWPIATHVNVTAGANDVSGYAIILAISKTSSPSLLPTATWRPSAQVTPRPSPHPPSLHPTAKPTQEPTEQPSLEPTAAPTLAHTASRSAAPTAGKRSSQPSPKAKPSVRPSPSPSDSGGLDLQEPTPDPTTDPSATPTQASRPGNRSKAPTPVPTSVRPSKAKTTAPTHSPSRTAPLSSTDASDVVTVTAVQTLTGAASELTPRLFGQPLSQSSTGSKAFILAVQAAFDATGCCSAGHLSVVISSVTLQPATLAGAAARALQSGSTSTLAVAYTTTYVGAVAAGVDVPGGLSSFVRDGSFASLFTSATAKLSGSAVAVSSTMTIIQSSLTGAPSAQPTSGRVGALSGGSSSGGASASTTIYVGVGVAVAVVAAAAMAWMYFSKRSKRASKHPQQYPQLKLQQQGTFQSRASSSSSAAAAGGGDLGGLSDVYGDRERLSETVRTSVTSNPLTSDHKDEIPHGRDSVHAGTL